MKRRGPSIVIGASLLLLSLCLTTFLCPRAALCAEKRYSFGVVPQFEQRKLYAIWQPIITELEKRTGLAFDLVTTLGITDFEKEFAKGSFDFAFANPYHAAQVYASQGYIPLVADKAPIYGILVVRKDSPIQNAADLNGKVVAFPTPNAIGASLLIRADLEQLFHTAVKPIYVKTHSSVYLHVIQHLAAAGGGVEKTLREQDASIRDALRVLYTTRSVPSHPVTAHPRVPQRRREQVRRAFLEMARTSEGKALLGKVPINQIAPVTPGDYTVMLTWGLDTYWQPVREED